MTVYQAFPNPTAPAEPAPKSVQRAAYLMYAGAVIYLISGVVGLISVVNATRRSTFALGHDSSSETATGLSGAATAVIAVIVVVSIAVTIGLWLWMAWKCRSGRSWARVVSTVFFGLATLSTLLTVVTSASSPWALLGAVAGWLAGLGATIFLWQRSSSWYFRAASRY